MPNLMLRPSAVTWLLLAVALLVVCPLCYGGPPNASWPFPQCHAPVVLPVTPPPPPHKPAITIDLQMRDGVRLNTIVYFPNYARKQLKPVGTVLFRTPYNATSLQSIDGVSTELLPYIVDPGLAVVLQDVRGCGPILGCGREGAHGAFNFPNHSVLDGYDTVDWVAKQPWSNGKVALSGPSALSVDSYETMTLEPHPAIKAVFLAVGEAAEHKQWFPGGAYRVGMAEIYVNTIGQSTLSTRASEVIGELRKNEAWGDAWSQQSGFYVNQKDGLSGWDRGRKAAIPGIHVAGLYDPFREAQLETFNELNNTELGATAPQWLWLAPGGHCLGSAVGWGLFQMLPPDSVVFSTSLFHLHVGDPTKEERDQLIKDMAATPRVSYYLVGPGIPGTFGNSWHHARAFPDTESQRWYVAEGGRLALGHPGIGEKSLIYDPADPVGTSGGNNLFIQPCGPEDQNLVEATKETADAFNHVYSTNKSEGGCLNITCSAECYSRLSKLYYAAVESPRPDVLRFDSPSFREATPILGNVSVELEVSSNATDTDFVVKITDVFPNGTSMLIQKGAQRMRWRDGPFATKPTLMVAGEKYRVNVLVGWVGYVMNKGHKLRLVVTSSTWPFYSVNPNTGDPLDIPPLANHTVWPPWGPCEMGECHNVTARNTVHFGEHAAVVLPVMHHLPPPINS